MRQPKTDIPGLIFSEHGKVAHRVHACRHRPEICARTSADHGDLLANVVRWAVADDIPLTVEGPGLIDCHLYRQQSHLILHLVNLTSANTWRAPVEELIPVGPIKVKVRFTGRQGTARLLVSNASRPVTFAQGMATVEIGNILDHELVVIG